ncbi:MAG: glycosyltransferase family 4 protein [bacterium]|nr:glycosyltransferase family 4 protein [bacterium]
MAYRIGIDARKLTDFGIGTYIQNLLPALARVDSRNQYLIFARPEHADFVAELPDNFRFVSEKAKGYTARELVALPWQILRRRLDLFHATHYVLPYLVACKTVVSIHDIIHMLYPEFLPNRLAHVYASTMIRHGLSRGDRIIASSQNTKNDLLETFHIDGRKIEVVYLGVPRRFRARIGDEAAAEVLKRLGLTKPYVLFVGNPKPHKNLTNVLSAFARSREIKDFEADLVCVGDSGKKAFRIQQQAKSLGIGSHLKLAGRVSNADLPAIYQQASLFVYPTLYEGFGFPIVEAMASGVPVVTSNKSALKEVAEGYADLVNPLDVEEMAGAIAHCMTDPEHRNALARLGLRRAEDFRWQRTAKKTLAIYLSVLGASAETERALV